MRKPTSAEVTAITEMMRMIRLTMKEIDLPPSIVSSIYMSLATTQFIEIFPRGHVDADVLASWQHMIQAQADRFQQMAKAATFEELIELAKAYTESDMQGPKN